MPTDLRNTRQEPVPKRTGFLLWFAIGASGLACVADATAQSIPMNLSRPEPSPASDEPPPVAREAVEASGDYLARMDTDLDGRISVAEYQDWLGYAFTRMDTDGDGTLAAHELPGGRGRPVSLADHRQTLAERFARQDRNRDGFLDAQELLAPPQ